MLHSSGKDDSLTSKSIKCAKGRAEFLGGHVVHYISLVVMKTESSICYGLLRCF